MLQYRAGFHGIRDSLNVGIPMLLDIIKRIPLYIFVFTFIFFISAYFTLTVVKDTFLYRGANATGSGTLVINKGETFNSIISKLDSYGFVKDKKLFRVFLRLMMLDRVLKAGEYKVTGSMSALTMVGKIIENDTVDHYFSVPPGLSACQTIKKLMSEPSLVGDAPEDLMDGDILADTYSFKMGESRKDLVARMKSLSQKAYDKLWSERSDNTPYKSMRDVIIVASIIEKEAKNSDFGLVSGVIKHRLKRRMKLEMDSTTVYAMYTGCKSLNRDLNQGEVSNGSPFNTYRFYGLPPSPISNVGIDSINAAMNPVETNHLFFFLDDDGTMHFSPSYEQHASYVKKARAQRKMLQLQQAKRNNN